jgi:hypothetical protein
MNRNVRSSRILSFVNRRLRYYIPEIDYSFGISITRKR